MQSTMKSTENFLWMRLICGLGPNKLLDLELEDHFASTNVNENASLNWHMNFKSVLRFASFLRSLKRGKKSSYSKPDSLYCALQTTGFISVWCNTSTFHIHCISMFSTSGFLSWGLKSSMKMAALGALLYWCFYHFLLSHCQWCRSVQCVNRTFPAVCDKMKCPTKV